MLGLSAPMRGIISGVLATAAGFSVYNLSQRPTTQTIEGVDNTTLIAIAGVAALFIWFNAPKG